MPDLNLLSDAEKDELIRTLFVQLQELVGTVAELKGRLALNSANSSKPPQPTVSKNPTTKTDRRAVKTRAGKRAIRETT